MKSITSKQVQTINCKECNCEISSSNNRKFCSRKCSITHNNRGRRRHGDAPGNCKVCDKKLRGSSMLYCSHACEISFKWKEQSFKIIKGEISSPLTLRKFIIERDCHICSICKNEEWMGSKIPLILDHVDGHSENNKSENLRMVCGNCDMQLSTYKK